MWQVGHIFYRSFSSKIIILQQLYGLIALPLDMMITVFNKLVVVFFFFFFLQQLPVVTSSTIVRCRSCRTYINPFVSFLDQRRWKCNLCYRVNDGMFFLINIIVSIVGKSDNINAKLKKQKKIKKHLLSYLCVILPLIYNFFSLFFQAFILIYK